MSEAPDANVNEPEFCKTCEGRSRVECETCDGDGCDCAYCGRGECDVCDGAGTIDCPDCTDEGKS